MPMRFDHAVHPVVVDLPTFLSSATVARSWLRPLGIITGGIARLAIERGIARPLVGSTLAYSAVELLSHGADGIIMTMTTLLTLSHTLKGESALSAKIHYMLDRLSRPRPPWAGFTFDKPLIMGILNITPDSFFDGDRFLEPARAIAHGRAMIAAGADIIDIGGESTRPGATPVTPEIEMSRIEPVIRALAMTGAVISVDTRNPSVMEGALKAGARIINDISALSARGSLSIVARTKAPVVLMHMQGEPMTMQHAPLYELASLDIVERLEARIATCVAAGIARDTIVVDPGIGFGKTKAHNFEILAHIALFHGLGTGIVIGASRKSFLGMQSHERLPGSIAVAIHAVRNGVQILRVHDVAETRAAITTTEKLEDASELT